MKIECLDNEKDDRVGVKDGICDANGDMNGCRKHLHDSEST